MLYIKIYINGTRYYHNTHFSVTITSNSLTINFNEVNLGYLANYILKNIGDVDLNIEDYYIVHQYDRNSKIKDIIYKKYN